MFMFRKMLLATTATILLTGTALAAPIDTNGPSFDCSYAKTTLAQILCAGSDAAQADWDLNAAVWAYHADNPTAGNKNLENWSHSMNDRCRLPRPLSQDEQVGRAMGGQIGRMVLGPEFRIPGQQPITRKHVNCVVSVFHQEAASLRSKLRGDALAESNLGPDEQVAIEQALIDHKFMQNSVKGYTTETERQFGPSTRLAIRQFQRSIGANQTGVLSEAQRANLLETEAKNPSPPVTQPAPSQANNPSPPATQPTPPVPQTSTLEDDERLKNEIAKAEAELDKQRQEWRRMLAEYNAKVPNTQNSQRLRGPHHRSQTSSMTTISSIQTRATIKALLPK